MHAPLTPKQLEALALAAEKIASMLYFEVLPAMWRLDTTLGQAQIGVALRQLGDEGRQPTVTEIALHLDRPRSSVQNIVDQLEERGLLTFRTDPNDRRRRLIMPTTSGAKMIVENRALWADFCLRAFQRSLAAVREAGAVDTDQADRLNAFLEDARPMLAELIDRHRMKPASADTA